MVLANEVNMLASDIQGALPHIKAGKLRALMVTGLRRLAALPDVPTGGELGLPDFEAVGWLGFMAPTGTAREIVAKLNTEINRGLTAPDVASRFASNGVELMPGSPEEFEAFIDRSSARWGKVIKVGNIKGEQ